MHRFTRGTFTTSSGVVQDVRNAFGSPLSHVGMHTFVPVKGGTEVRPVSALVVVSRGCIY